MKIRQVKEQTFSGKVEVAITALDNKGNRLSSKSFGDIVTRKSIRLDDTSVPEVYAVVIKALQEVAA